MIAYFNSLTETSLQVLRAKMTILVSWPNFCTSWKTVKFFADVVSILL